MSHNNELAGAMADKAKGSLSSTFTAVHLKLSILHFYSAKVFHYHRHYDHASLSVAIFFRAPLARSALHRILFYVCHAHARQLQIFA